MHSHRRPSISLIPLVRVNNEPPPHDVLVDTPTKRYQVSRQAVILSVMFFTVLILLAIFTALFTSFVQAQHSAAAAASSAAARETSS